MVGRKIDRENGKKERKEGRELESHNYECQVFKRG